MSRLLFCVVFCCFSRSGLRENILDENPADKHGRHLYSFADTGMDEGELRERFHEYQSFFDVPSEAV